jgi:hypothetical protein
VANKITLPNIRQLQFIVLGVTGVINGKKTKDKERAEKTEGGDINGHTAAAEDQRRNGPG